ncbi:MAG TPA: hypothetical protein VFR39_07440, partial [Burkholderiales bacterium]|nr:hypothetical protein [Burkholderiales bacterium]
MDADHSKDSKHPVWAVLFALVGMVSGMPAGAQDIPAPPYYISRGEYVVIGIAYEESRLKKLAPAGVQMAPGATGVIVMYTASESYGLPPYSSSW